MSRHPKSIPVQGETQMKRLASLLSAVMILGAGVLWAESPPRYRATDLDPEHRAKRLDPTFPNLDHGLNRVLLDEAPLALAQRLGYRVRDGRVQVAITTESGRAAELIDGLRQSGARYLSSAGDRVQAHVSPAVLETLAQSMAVRSVRRPIYPRPEENHLTAESAKAVTGALYSMNIAPWNDAGFTGEGVKVGVLDVQFGGYEDLIGEDLPPAERVHYRAFGASELDDELVHGTACAEIIHDIAPDVELYLALIETGDDIVEALDWYIEEGVRIVSMSLGLPFWTGPGDGTGDFAEIAQILAEDYGLVFVTSAGNERDTHWQGQTVDPDSDGWVNFTEDDEYLDLVDCSNYSTTNFSEDDEVFVMVGWSDWTVVGEDFSSDQDYSLHLMRMDGAEPVEVDVADDLQTGLEGHWPVEVVEFTISEPGQYGIAVNRKDVAGLHDIEVFTDPCAEHRVGSGSLSQPADAEYIMSVAAVDTSTPYVFHDYSSAGPTNGPGGTIEGGSVKPDISGYAGVRTESYQSFSGTSAACPHVAAAAALTLSARPGWTPEEVRFFLEQERAIDKGEVEGKDNDYGWGRVTMGDVLEETCTYGVAPWRLDYGAEAGSGSFDVNTPDGCEWDVSTSDGWIQLAKDAGSGGVSFTVAANGSASARTGAVIVEDKTFTVTQEASTDCSYTISPLSQSFGPAGGGDTVSVDTVAGCEWTAVADVAWIDVAAGASGSGPGTVTYTVAANTGDVRSGTLTIAGATYAVYQLGGSGTGERVYRVAGIARTEGVGGVAWRSALCVTNRSGSTANLTLVYRFGGSIAVRTHVLSNGGTVEWVDVAKTLFGQTGDSSGAIEIGSDVEVIITDRTYADTVDGTYGQFYPGLDQDDALTAGHVGVLPQIKKVDAFRTNVGFVNLGSAGCSPQVRLYDSQGTMLGASVSTSVGPGKWKQLSDIFAKAGVASCALCYATVEVAGDCLLWAYASLVDNDTDDPTTVPLFIE
jgi:subtilisin family serine protease